MSQPNPATEKQPPSGSLSFPLPPIAGAGIGSLIAYWATTLPDTSTRKWLLIAAPSLAIFINAIGYWLFKWMSAWEQERIFNRRTQYYKDILKRGLGDPLISLEQKQRLQDKYDKIIDFEAQHYLERIQAIKDKSEIVSFMDELEKQMNSNQPDKK
jgi:hypothetical protein